MMFYCVKSCEKFKILDKFNELLCYWGLCIKFFHRVLSTVTTENRHISSIGCTDKSLKSHVSMFLDFSFVGLKRYSVRCGDFAQC